jgi:hypothetical protein
MQVPTGRESLGGRFDAAVEATHAAHDAHGYTVDGSAHSLGGSLLIHTTEKLGHHEWYGQQTTFNPGTSPFGKSSKPHDSSNAHKITHIRQEHDPVSMATPAFGRVVTYNTTADPAAAHSLLSFVGPADPPVEDQPVEDQPVEDQPMEEQPVDATNFVRTEGGETQPFKILGYVLYRPEDSAAYVGKTVAWL